jgi:hypothetical protein
MMRRLAVLAVACCFATSASAADDDDLAPLTPLKKPAKVPAKAVKAPARPPAKKAPTAKKAPVVDDDLTPLSPVVSKADLIVRVAAISGAVLSIDNKEVGTLPLGPQSLPTGEHLITVKRVGFATFVKKVTLFAGKPLEVEARLAPVAAVLSVTSDVTDAQVLINGRVIGTAPITDHEVPPGLVEISVLKEGFREDKQKLALLAGRDYPVVVKLNVGGALSDRPVETQLVPMPVAPGPMAVTEAPALTPVYQRWYFWAGMAAVVAAGVGTAVAVTSANQLRKRPEGEICTIPVCHACIGLSCVSNRNTALSF